MTREDARMAPAVAPDRTVPTTGRAGAPMLVLRSGKPTPLVAGRRQRVGKGAVDVCFVFDTTGSMSDKIDGLVRCTADLVGELDRLGLDWRVVTLPFGDLTVPGDRIVADMPFVADRAAAEDQLRRMPRFSGGGNEGESAIEAMQQAAAREYRAGAVRIVILLTDEPALVTGQIGPGAVTSRLRQAEMVCFVGSPDRPYYREWATANGGKWFPIGPSMDFSVVVDMLRSLVREVAAVAHAVHQLGGGSVGRYLELTSGSDQP